ncbi:MAG: hypothetical protein KBA33_00900 [Cloacibacterium sp.]|nr:hypothetical protein [Cloacibacterium sp.]
MRTSILQNAENFFDRIHHIWESATTSRLLSFILVMVFLSVSGVSFLAKWELPFFDTLKDEVKSPFYAIEISFTILLVFELLSLIFVLPNSVSKSVGKQLELLSLIFIRGAFKEFSHIKDFDWEGMSEQIINMSFYTIGALLIFIMLGLATRFRKHYPLSTSAEDNNRFIQAKKLIALLLIFFSLIVGFSDLILMYRKHNFSSSFHTFHTFYTLLIFSDILIVLIALRYTMSYYKIFRYSAFVVATIFIRLALSAEMYFNIIIGVSVAAFVLLLTISYNYFIQFSKEKDM